MPANENDPPQPQQQHQRPPAPSRRRAGRFPKGVSGNPKGRPRGSRNRSTLIMESLFQSEAENLTRKVIEMAKEGDSLAMRICMDRLLPAQRDRPIDLPLGPVDTLPQVRAGMSTVLEAIGNGSITPTEGETVAQVLHLQSEVVTSAELAPRVVQLEEQMAALHNQPGNSRAEEVTQILRADHGSGEAERNAA